MALMISSNYPKTYMLQNFSTFFSTAHTKWKSCVHIGNTTWRYTLNMDMCLVCSTAKTLTTYISCLIHISSVSKAPCIVRILIMKHETNVKIIIMKNTNLYRFYTLLVSLQAHAGAYKKIKVQKMWQHVLFSPCIWHKCS